MDAHLIALYAPSLVRFLLGARIEKIQEFANHHLGLSLYNFGQKRYLYFRFERQHPMFFLGSMRIKGTATPSARIMLLRKYFEARRIEAVIVKALSRQIWLMVSGNGNKIPWLCLDLAHGPQLHFLDKEMFPKEEVFKWPAKDELTNALRNWHEWPTLTPFLRKTLATLSFLDQAALISDLAEGGGYVFLYRDEQNKIRKISAWHIEGSGQEEACEPTFENLEKAGYDLVLDPLALQQEKSRRAPLEKRIKKLNRILAKLEKDEVRLRNMAAAREIAQAIQGDLWKYPSDYHSEQIKAKVGKEDKILPLQKKWTLAENMEHLFGTAKKGEKGLHILAQRKQEVKNELETLIDKEEWHPSEKIFNSQSASSRTSNYMYFRSSDGYVMLRGKNARGNVAIRKHASPHDIWVHVEQGTGAHVIIRRAHIGDEVPEATLVEAGSLALNKSWLSEAGSGSVIYAEVRHIKNIGGGAIGRVTIDKIRATKIVRADKSLEEKLLPSCKK